MAQPQTPAITERLKREKERKEARIFDLWLGFGCTLQEGVSNEEEELRWNTEDGTTEIFLPPATEERRQELGREQDQRSLAGLATSHKRLLARMRERVGQGQSNKEGKKRAQPEEKDGIGKAEGKRKAHNEPEQGQSSDPKR